MGLTHPVANSRGAQDLPAWWSAYLTEGYWRAAGEAVIRAEMERRLLVRRRLLVPVLPAASLLRWWTNGTTYELKGLTCPEGWHAGWLPQPPGTRRQHRAIQRAKTAGRPQP